MHSGIDISKQDFAERHISIASTAQAPAATDYFLKLFWLHILFDMCVLSSKPFWKKNVFII